jgi:hypothetical protein
VKNVTNGLTGPEHIYLTQAQPIDFPKSRSVLGC